MRQMHECGRDVLWVAGGEEELPGRKGQGWGPVCSGPGGNRPARSHRAGSSEVSVGERSGWHLLHPPLTVLLAADGLQPGGVTTGVSAAGRRFPRGLGVG